MIVFKNGCWQTDSDHPDDNWLDGLECEQPEWVIPDYSPLASKITSLGDIEPVTNEHGELIDVKSPEPTTEQKIAEFKQQLAELDLQAVRPLRAIAAGTATDEDKSRLAEIEGQAEALRAEIAEMGEAVTE